MGSPPPGAPGGSFAASGGRRRNPYWNEVIRAARRYGMDPLLIDAVMYQESSYNPRAVSPKGARGLMQFMPGTARRYGLRNPHDPTTSIDAGTHYLRDLRDMFGGDQVKMLAGFNAGEGAVRKYGRVPPYPETRNYVQRIQGDLKRQLGATYRERVPVRAFAPEGGLDLTPEEEARVMGGPVPAPPPGAGGLDLTPEEEARVMGGLAPAPAGIPKVRLKPADALKQQQSAALADLERDLKTANPEQVPYLSKRVAEMRAALHVPAPAFPPRAMAAAPSVPRRPAAPPAPPAREQVMGPGVLNPFTYQAHRPFTAMERVRSYVDPTFRGPSDQAPLIARIIAGNTTEADQRLQQEYERAVTEGRAPAAPKLSGDQKQREF